MNWPDDFVNKIICGDCLDVVKDIPDKSIDLLLTDPPYGIKRDKGFEGFEGFGGFGKPIARRRYEQDNWDSQRPKKVVFDEILRISKKAIIFGGNFFADLLPQGTHWIVWDKLNTMPTFGDCELLWTNIDRKSVKKITYQYNGLLGKERWRSHPTQKPLELLKRLIDSYSEPGDLVFDPFVGSGTTAVAAKELGRKWSGVEIQSKYCEIAEERLRQEVLPF
jgi:DNA modification methylase